MRFFTKSKRILLKLLISSSHFTHTGWAQGRSILDGFSGWFPKDLTVQLYAGRKSVTFLVDEEEPTIYASIALSNRFSVA
jgi:hypothetical protein